MLTGIRVVVLGGDARQLEVIRKCVDMDATVSVVGFDKLEVPLKGVTLEPMSVKLLESSDALILPVVGCDEEGNVNALFGAQKLQFLNEHAAALPPHCVVYTGMARTYLKEICTRHELKLVELLERDDVAIYNSIPTAEGALMMAIQHTDFTIHGADCMVLGMGRTGFTMARALQGLGARVKVGVRRAEDAARAVEMGWKPFMTRDLAQETKGVDLIFNTIPSMIITAQILSKLPLSTVIIDLASAPGGCDFRYAEKRGIKAVLAPGLPGIVAPKTAGAIIANTLVQLLMEDNPDRGDAQ
ncbi:dipicolinate synthase subunit DpsA [Paenibacillus polymyxa]|uniref:dipicolinate synthase subunit DpsA n=1 Tax=Paenibacillus polymyxa TaxID=1406 RepID=UPI0003D35F18|nr:dipicolinate synthase subunit DpsA [Paenibacillus polymyxa]AHC19639.1 dipicolinate synthase subunit A [Paenibacillus polymyxa CR1]